MRLCGVKRFPALKQEEEGDELKYAIGRILSSVSARYCIPQCVRLLQVGRG